MIKLIELKNFQRHKHLKLELSDINIILGGNNRGKTAIVRAINWIFTNKPRGDWMCRIDENNVKYTVEVKIVFDDNTVIKRIKGKSVNKYELNGIEYNDFGDNVPVEILDVLNINYKFYNRFKVLPNVELSDEEIFLIKEQNTVKAQMFNELIGASIFEKTIKYLNKNKLSLSKLINIKDEELRNVNLTLEQYDILDKISFNKVEKLIEKVKNIEENLRKINILYEDFLYQEKIIKQYEVLKDVYKDILYSLEQLDAYNDVINLIDKLKDIKIRFNKYNKINELPEIDFTSIDRDINKLADKQLIIDKMMHLYKQYKSIKKNIKQNKIIIKELEDKSKEYKNEICPICGNKIGKVI